MVSKLTNIYLCDSINYSALSRFDENGLYFVTDKDTNTKSIYRGSTTKIGGEFIIVNGIQPDEPEEGVIYYISEFKEINEGVEKIYPFAGFYTKEGWVSLCRDTSEEFAKKQDKLTEGRGISIDDNNVISSTIDLSLYKIVSALPTEDIDENKIYLVLDTTGQAENTFKEYVHHPDGWELLGEYKASIDLTPYLKKADADKSYIPKPTTVDISFSSNGSMNNYGDNGQAFNGVRDVGDKSLTGKPINAAAFGVKLDGTTGFSHKTYTTFEPTTGKYTGAKNTAVLSFSGVTGLRYAKNTGNAPDVTEEMYKYVGVIDSTDEKQRVYSAKQVDDLIKGLTDTIAALEARVKELEEK